MIFLSHKNNLLIAIKIRFFLAFGKMNSKTALEKLADLRESLGNVIRLLEETRNSADLSTTKPEKISFIRQCVADILFIFSHEFAIKNFESFQHFFEFVHMRQNGCTNMICTRFMTKYATRYNANTIFF